MITKLSEFNFKLLHNIVPCGYVLSKWQCNINVKCEVCGEVESTKHMLFECERVKCIWKLISVALKCDISWKRVICGYPNYEVSKKINTM